jgi:hypothetical protein
MKHLYHYNTSLTDTSPELVSKVTTAVGNNPTYNANLYCGVFRPDGSTGNVSYRIQVKMWLNVELSARVFLATS